MIVEEASAISPGKLRGTTRLTWNEGSVVDDHVFEPARNGVPPHFHDSSFLGRVLTVLADAIGLKIRVSVDV